MTPYARKEDKARQMREWRKRNRDRLRQMREHDKRLKQHFKEMSNDHREAIQKVDPTLYDLLVARFWSPKPTEAQRK